MEPLEHLGPLTPLPNGASLHVPASYYQLAAVFLAFPCVLLGFNALVCLHRGTRYFVHRWNATFSDRPNAEDYAVLPQHDDETEPDHSLASDTLITPASARNLCVKQLQTTHSIRRFIEWTLVYCQLIGLLLLCAVYLDKYTPATSAPVLRLIIGGHVGALVAWVWFLVLRMCTAAPPTPQLPSLTIVFYVLSWCGTVANVHILLAALTPFPLIVPALQIVPQPGLVCAIHTVLASLSTTLLVLAGVQNRYERLVKSSYAAPKDDIEHWASDQSYSFPSARSSADEMASEDIRRPSVKYKPEIPSMSITDFIRRIPKLVPFLFPRGSPKRNYFFIAACFGLVLLGRWVNLLVPSQYKVVVDRLSDYSLLPIDIFLFVVLKVVQGNIGVLQTLHDFFWTPVSQYTTRAVSVHLFRHLHSLPLTFHTNRKTGEILRIQDRGVASIESLLSCILFKIIPTIADISIACLYFSLRFDLYFGCIIIVTMTAYIVSTITLTEWHKQHRRRSNLLDNELEAKVVDSLLNYETVKHNNAQDFEVGLFAEAMRKYQGAEWMNVVSLNALHAVQNLSMQLGMLGGCLLCTKRILDHDMTVGDFVLFLSYLSQMYVPLNWFGNSYRVIQKNFVDMERMLDVLDEPSECAPRASTHVVLQEPPASAPVPTQGQGVVEFKHVTFSYPNSEPILRNISFRVPSGSTVALVGPSGSGKSTILKLLYRFHELDSGTITIDGHNVQDMSHQQLRSQLGMVPQDTTLFNDTIRYNIQYGRAGDGFDTVTLADVKDAARCAQIHSKVESLPDKYNTGVGERGARLSGGERQRIAIARTMLKNPRIILLDEATSALDTYTELNIQSALQNMAKDRTTLVVAHRLSTIIHADLILVVKDGEIVERGSHMSLLDDPDGLYYQLWMTQLREERNLHRYQRRLPTITPPSQPEVHLDDDEAVDSASLSSLSLDGDRPHTSLRPRLSGCHCDSP
ncbi:ATP-binding cassette-type vacuolar membrane transporter Hmt1 [Dimargaris verticillata]|uniref:ATP-binding cassette-type vacuolar membrane transporter Hmt1 n=1 Tax=Dimargaris verticillata TaxID=2761393 RepID=A0A9W8B9E8_9FUNG|nr:ATP-binding cassette-type vacuolar membrane transporter Hmt1 [Dimargaris verticillata]